MRLKSFRQHVSERAAILIAHNAIFEGGKVFHDETKRINKDQVDATISDIEKNLFPTLGLKLDNNVIRLGSSGHSETSGDIDFGIIGMDLSKLHDLIKSKFSNKTNFIKGLEVLSIEWPIEGDEENGLVQLDFIPVYDRDWTEFIYKYPTESKYKSAHRNWLFMAVLSSIRNNVEKDETTDEPLSYDGYMLNLNKGLFSMKKDYQGKTKILKHGQIVDDKLITTNPKEFVEFVFGKGYKPKDVRTFEECWHIINNDNFKWIDNIDDIKKNLKKFLSRVELPIPTELD